MKTYLFSFFSLLVSTWLFWVSCNKETENLNSKTINLNGNIGIVYEKNRIDKYIDAYFRTPYNIDIQYKWDDKEFDQSRFLIPADTAVIMPILIALKTVWLDNYVKLGGVDFMKKIAPKLIVISGGSNYNTDGTLTQGVAEAAQKITFFQANDYTPTNLSIISRYFVIMQHEFAHILNQARLFDIATYQSITPSAYRADWYNMSSSDALYLGLITPYAAANYNEDFAEMISTILTNDKAKYDEIINDLSTETNSSNVTYPNAKVQIQSKEKLIADYYRVAWNIDLYQLRDSMAKYTAMIVNP